MKNTEIKSDVKYKFKVYDLKNEKALTREEIFTVLGKLILLKNNEVEFRSNEEFYVAPFLNCCDKRDYDLFERDIVLYKFRDKFTQKIKEKGIGILIYNGNNLLPMMKVIGNVLYNLKHYIEEKELEVVKIGNFIEHKDLFEFFVNANDLHRRILDEKFNENCNSEKKVVIKSLENEMKEIKKSLFKSFNF